MIMTQQEEKLLSYNTIQTQKEWDEMIMSSSRSPTFVYFSYTPSHHAQSNNNNSFPTIWESFTQKVWETFAWEVAINLDDTFCIDDNQTSLRLVKVDCTNAMIMTTTTTTDNRTAEEKHYVNLNLDLDLLLRKKKKKRQRQQLLPYDGITHMVFLMNHQIIKSIFK